VARRQAGWQDFDRAGPSRDHPLHWGRLAVAGRVVPVGKELNGWERAEVSRGAGDRCAECLIAPYAGAGPVCRAGWERWAPGAGCNASRLLTDGEQRSSKPPARTARDPKPSKGAVRRKERPWRSGCLVVLRKVGGFCSERGRLPGHRARRGASR